MPITLPLPSGRTVVHVAEDECMHCSAPIAIGRDYCGVCDQKLQQGLLTGTCGFCEADLPPEELRDGYCPACGVSLVNPPPITFVPRRPR